MQYVTLVSIVTKFDAKILNLLIFHSIVLSLFSILEVLADALPSMDTVDTDVEGCIY